MIRVWTWVKILLALLILPAVAAGGAFSVCTCHHETVYMGDTCGCKHGHLHKSEQQKQEQPQHHCTHVENEMQPTSGHISLPEFADINVEIIEVPSFHRCHVNAHHMVTLTLERVGLWEPPDTRCCPLLI
ncbi:MAG: hypothetical protein E7031_00960 [Akkermansiaceae bacterium]|nr:hypothetical protein [Akkermansiaceae bacterium]